MTAERTIDYEALARDAMRGVVRTVLQQVAKSGLPGDHHFYVSFDTQMPGVNLSKRLKEKYPEEMTIVLQHRFWDLAVTDDRFEVKLTFDGIPERLVVPFGAIKVFFDPSVRYGLQFDEAEADGDATAPTAGGREGHDPRGAASAKPLGARKPRAPRKPRVEKSADAEGAAAPNPGPSLAPIPKPNGPVPIKPAPQPTLASVPPAPKAPDGGDQGEQQQAGAKVVSLSDFRKK